MLHIDRGDRGVDTIQNINVGELSDISRVDVLEDCLVEKSFSDLTWDRSFGLEGGRKIPCELLLWLNLSHGPLFQCPVVRIYFQLWKVMYSLHVRSNLFNFPNVLLH